MLCNLAAAEILMPIGSFQDAALKKPSIEQVLELRARFDLSMRLCCYASLGSPGIRSPPFVAAPMEDPPRTAIASNTWHCRGRDSGHAEAMHCLWILLCGNARRSAFTAGAWRRGHLARSLRSAVRRDTPVSRIRPAKSRRARAPSQPWPGASSRDPVPRWRCHRSLAARKPWLIAHLVNDKTPNWGGAFCWTPRPKWPSVQADFKTWARRARPWTR